MSDWIFITGGSGYLGSHIAAHLKTVTDHSVMIIDRRANLVPHITRFCDIFADEDFSSDLIMQAIRDYRPKTIIHCADDPCMENGLISPLSMWEENVVKTIKLLKVCSTHGVGNVIFHSTAEIHGDSDQPISESSPINPLKAYARSKLGIEHLLRDCYIAHGINSVSLRTFSIAGAHPLYDLGPLYRSPYLVPQIMEAATNASPMQVYGKDYHTADGTAIRDYVHVMDVVQAVMLSMEWVQNHNGAHAFTIGRGTGTSVQQMLDMAESLLSKSIPYTYEDRRTGDPAMRIANPSLAKSTLGWSASKTTREILLDSFKWYNSPTYVDLRSKGIWHTWS